MFTGPTGCGKTHILKKLLRSGGCLGGKPALLVLHTSTSGGRAEYSEVPFQVGECTPEALQTTLSQIYSFAGEALDRGIKPPRTLVVVDDPIGKLELGKRDGYLASIASDIRKNNCTLLIMVQRFNIPATTIRDNTQMVVMWSPSDEQTEEVHGRSSSRVPRETFLRVCREHCNKPHAAIAVRMDYSEGEKNYILA